MQILLEIFYIQVVGDEVHYRRKQVDLSEAGEDPNRVIQSLIQQKYHIPSSKIEDEFVIHSTSWRYTAPDEIFLTYVAYSDEIDIDREPVQNISLEDLRVVTVSTPHPLSPAELEKQVVSHAMRHIAFLVKTDSENVLSKVLAPKTLEVFETLWVALAGRVF
jgi:hypothetical protein